MATDYFLLINRLDSQAVAGQEANCPRFAGANLGCRQKKDSIGTGSRMAGSGRPNSAKGHSLIKSNKKIGCSTSTKVR